MGVTRVLPMDIEVGDEAGNEYQVDRPVADDLIGDARVAASCLLGRWLTHGAAPAVAIEAQIVCQKNGQSSRDFGTEHRYFRMVFRRKPSIFGRPTKPLQYWRKSQAPERCRIGTAIAIPVVTAGQQRDRSKVMSDIEYYNDRHPPMSGCICGRHRSQLEHDHEERHMLQCVPVEREPRRYDGVLASATLRSAFAKN